MSTFDILSSINTYYFSNTHLFSSLRYYDVTLLYYNQRYIDKIGDIIRIEVIADTNLLLKYYRKFHTRTNLIMVKYHIKIVKNGMLIYSIPYWFIWVHTPTFNKSEIRAKIKESINNRLLCVFSRYPKDTPHYLLQ